MRIRVSSISFGAGSSTANPLRFAEQLLSSGRRPEEKRQRFRKPLGPFSFIVGRAFVNPDPQSVFSQPGAPENEFQRANVFHDLSVALYTSRFLGSHRHENLVRPLPEGTAGL